MPKKKKKREPGAPNSWIMIYLTEQDRSELWHHVRSLGKTEREWCKDALLEKLREEKELLKDVGD